MAMDKGLDPVRLQVELSREDAWALAQFLKRSTYETYQACAVDKAEVDQMLSAVSDLREALGRAGVNPR